MTALVPAPARVVAVREELAGVTTLTLATPLARALRPGQFNMLYAFGVGEAAISTSGDPAARDVAVHTIRAVGPVTRALCAAREGDVIGLRGPYGTPWPLDVAGADLLIVAGGLGLAPLRAAIFHVLAQRAAYGRVTVLVGARSPADMLYAGALARWRERADLEVLVTVDHADTTWTGHVGVVTALLDHVELGAQPLALVCGPEVMMQFTVRELARRGVSADRIYLSLERNMKCAVGHCGRCQLGPSFVCKDGPVLRRDRLDPWLTTREA